MELSQMLVQGMWDKDPAVMQLPHVTREIGERCVAAGVEGVYDLIDMEDDARRELLELSDGQLEDVAEAANRYPSVEVAFDIVDPEDVTAGDAVEIIVNLEREHEGDVGPVFAPRYPAKKEEGWWLVVGDAKKGTLHAIKRVSLGKKQKVKLEFAAPERVGAADLTLYFMADSYLGCDQEYEFTLDVKEGEDESDDDAMAT
jgi:pre-mRNA-splicing helicase BRR2